MIEVARVEALLDSCYIAAEGASLRDEDRKKAIEIAAFLDEIARVQARTARARRFVLVDAAAGKGYVALLAAKLVLRPGTEIVSIERLPARAVAAQNAAKILGIPVDARIGDVGDPALWPAEPALVTALHACGPAADAVLAAAVATRAARVLLVPCCTPAAAGDPRAERLGIPRHAPVRRAFAESLLLAERTLRLEAAGYQTEVVAFVPPTVTPYNLLFRARRVGEPQRMAHARQQLERLKS